ncbi:MAG: hypothetical protein WCY30_03325 [Candidatus Neomarinimicrobiota bacterium]|jgi:hypothetical protein
MKKVIFICMLVLLIGCSGKVGDKKNAEYYFKITNGWVVKEYYFETNEVYDNIHILYDKDGEFLAEIHQPENYLVTIEKNMNKRERKKQ